MLKTELALSEARQKIKSFIRKKVEDAQADGVVVAISGGIDSAVTACLCVEALGGRRVMGVMMPDLRVTPDEDVVDSRRIASELSIEVKSVDIARVHSAFMRDLESNRLAEGNLRARIRMAILYYYGNSLNRLVVGTGDRSELLLGHYTKYGDGGVDILPIADLYKTEVRRLGEILGVNRGIMSKKSSPRPWPGQLAESETGLPYDVVDDILKLHFDQEMDAEGVASRLKVDRSEVEAILSRYGRSGHKRQMPEICKVH